MDRGLRRALRRLRSDLLNRSDATIQRDHIREDVAYLPVSCLNAGEVKTVDEDREALAASQICDSVVRLPRLAENLSALGMAGAVDVPHVVRPCSRGCKKTNTQQNKKSIAQHRPLLGPSAPRALIKNSEAEGKCVRWTMGQSVPKRHWPKCRVVPVKTEEICARSMAK